MPLPVFFNSLLDAEKTAGILLYYDMSLQQAGSALYDIADRKQDGTFYNSPTWDSGALCGNGSSQFVATGLNTTSNLRFPFSVIGRFALDTITIGGVFLAWRVAGLAYSWSIGTSYINLGRRYAYQGAALSAISSGKIIHLAVVYNSDSSVTAYVDGIDRTTTGDDYWNHDSDYMFIGARGNIATPTKFSDFRFEQLLVFNRALSRGEIVDHCIDPYCFFNAKAPAGILSGGGSTDSYNGRGIARGIARGIMR